ncbi:Gp23 family protein, partial [Listeria monocytogenes]
MYEGLTKVFDYALAKEMFFAALFVALFIILLIITKRIWDDSKIVRVEMKEERDKMETEREKRDKESKEERDKFISTMNEQQRLMDKQNDMMGQQ